MKTIQTQKKQFIKDFDKSLFMKIPETHRFQRKKELQSFTIDEMTSIKSFKSIYDKLTHDLTDRVVGVFGRQAGDYVIEQVKQRIQPFIENYKIAFAYLNEQDQSSLEIMKNDLNSANWNTFTESINTVDIIYGRLKNQTMELFNIDLNSVEQYFKNVIPKRLPKTDSSLPHADHWEYDLSQKFNVPKIVVNFKLQFIIDIKKYLSNALEPAKFLEPFFSNIKIDSYISRDVAKLVKKDIRTLVSDETIQQIINKNLYKGFILNIPGINTEHSKVYYNPSSRVVDNLSERNITALGEVKFLLETTGGVGFKNAAEEFKKLYPEIPDQILVTFIKYLYRENQAKFISDAVNFKATYFDYRLPRSGNPSMGFKVLLTLMTKLNKMDFNNLVKFYPISYSIGISVLNISNNLTHKDFTRETLPDIITSRIRNLNTIEEDLNSIKTIAEIIHNEGGNLPAKIVLALINNQNSNVINKIGIVKKVFKTIISIANIGGVAVIQKKYGVLIKELIKSKLIKPGIYKRIKFIVNVFESGELLNPSSPAFKNIFDVASSVETELNAIITSETYKELFVNYEQKNPNLFKLDMKINNNLRFRVLKDRDPRHLRMGLETSCCQRIGGMGETAARDSFVNPLAGVLILEWLDDSDSDSEWKLLTQSYFHYVDKENGYILDNVESNAGNIRKANVDLEEIYGWYATVIKAKLKINYFLAGKGYSKINKSQFATDKRDNDPRYFSPKALTKSNKDHYSDYDEKNSIDLTQPMFDVKELKPQAWGVREQIITTVPKTANILKLIRQNVLCCYAIAA